MDQSTTSNVQSESRHECHIECRQRINVLYERKEELDEAMMQHEIDRIQNLIKAKNDFNKRNDINFYISADDLLKIQSRSNPSGTRLNIKLMLDDNIHLKPDRLSSLDKLEKSPRKISPRHNTISGTTTNGNITSSKEKLLALQSNSATNSLADIAVPFIGHTQDTGFTSSRPPSPTHHKPIRKSSSADKSKLNTILSCSNTQLSVLSSNSKLHSKAIDLINYKVVIIYTGEDVTKYSTFIIERYSLTLGDGNTPLARLTCKGITSDIAGDALSMYHFYKSVIPLTIANAEFQLVSKDKLTEPISLLYVHSVSVNEYSVTQFVDNFRDIIFQCANNKV